MAAHIQGARKSITEDHHFELAVPKCVRVVDLVPDEGVDRATHAIERITRVAAEIIIVGFRKTECSTDCIWHPAAVGTEGGGLNGIVERGGIGVITEIERKNSTKDIAGGWRDRAIAKHRFGSIHHVINRSLLPDMQRPRRASAINA